MKLFGGSDKPKNEGTADSTVGSGGSEHRMSRINLLPWRAELRKERQTRFAAITGICLLITGLGVLSVHMYMQSVLDYQTRRNDYLQQQIKIAEKKIEEIKTLRQERQSLISRMEVIQKLQSSRPEVVHLFEELVSTLPEGVHYTSFQQNDKNISIDGVAQSGARVSRLMRNLEESKWLKNPVLKQTQLFEEGKRKLHKFSLSVQQDAPKPPKSEEEEK